jgi:type IV pilus assembly protein PilN
MIEINLLPVREARRKADLRDVLMQLVLALLITIGGATIVHSRISDELNLAAARVRQMETDIEQFKPQLAKVAEFRKRKANLQKKIDVIDGLDRARSGPVRIMDELAIRTPNRLWIKSLVTKGTTITLKGESLDNEIVAQFLKALGESDQFINVELDSTELGKDKDGLRLVSFHIHAQLVAPTGAEKKAG